MQPPSRTFPFQTLRAPEGSRIRNTDPARLPWQGSWGDLPVPKSQVMDGTCWGQCLAPVLPASAMITFFPWIMLPFGALELSNGSNGDGGCKGPPYCGHVPAAPSN